MGVGIGVAGVRWPEVTAKKQRKKKKKARPNAFGCLDVGDPCKNADQCCSGICEGKKGKRKCRAHGAGSCQTDYDGCNGLVAVCGTAGFCFRTTGNASFCGGPGGNCMVCAKDADCEPTHGPGAACVVCAGCNGVDGSQGTVCYPAAA
jgi:hypothetical protein